jgi:hypothetical protein
MSRTTEPTTITQGERIEWTKTFSDYPATDYTLQYRFRGDGVGINIDATADGDDFAVDLTAALSVTLAVKPYDWQAWLTEIADPTNTFPVANGRVTVKKGYASASTAAVDNRSKNKILLDAHDDMLEKHLLEWEVETQVGRRKMKYHSKKELLEARKYYATLVAQENAAERVRNGGTFGTSVKVAMYER